MLGSFGGFDDAYVSEMQKEVRRLESENTELKTQLAALRVEKEAALDTMGGWRERLSAAEGDLSLGASCRACRRFIKPGECAISGPLCKFEWRGPQGREGAE
jgi:hypothetical protein